VHVLIMVTNGWFTADAVRWIENHNCKGTLPTIEMWPQSHVELLLSAQPNLVATFRLAENLAPTRGPIEVASNR
jgi:hypothetical protein